MIQSSHFSLGTNVGLTRTHCPTCDEETIHQRDVCIHCGTSRRPAPKREKRFGFNNSTKGRRQYRVEFGGEHLSLKDISRRTGIAYATLTERFRNGLRGEELVAKVPAVRARPKGKAA